MILSVLLCVVAGVGTIIYCIAAAFGVFDSSKNIFVKILAICIALMGIGMVIYWVIMVANGYQQLH